MLTTTLESILQEGIFNFDVKSELFMKIFNLKRINGKVTKNASFHKEVDESSLGFNQETYKGYQEGNQKDIGKEKDDLGITTNCRLN